MEGSLILASSSSGQSGIKPLACLLGLGLILSSLAGCETTTTAKREFAPPPPQDIARLYRENRQARQALMHELEAQLLESSQTEAEAQLLLRIKPPRPPSPEIDRQVAEELKGLEKEKGAQLPITINAQVRQWIDRFQTTHRKRFALWLSRSGRYIPAMKTILREYSLPEDLVYLALIESGFSCKAYSRAHAVGPWQFIRSTGQRYGLKITPWVDERRDPIKSTHAAAQYLRDLYAEFGTWYLAAAGYNAGEARIRKALKLHKADNFWDIASPASRRSYIKRETRNYVPKMIAAAILAKDPARYGFGDVQYEAPLSFQVVELASPVDLKKVARAAGTTYAELMELNPELRHHVTPPTSGPYRLRVPPKSSLAWASTIDRYRVKAYRGYVVHLVKKGEIAGRIAQRYKVPVSRLLAANNINDPRRIRAGQQLKVPVSAETLLSREDREVSNSEDAPPRPRVSSSKESTPKESTPEVASSRTHVVRPGESVWKISQRYGVDHREILAANKISNYRSLRPGQRLIIPLSDGSRGAVQTAAAKVTTVVHVVKRGETVWEISRKYNVSYQQILSWNNIRDDRSLQPGQRLSLYLKEEG